MLEVWGRDMVSSRASDDPVDAFLRLACLSYTDPYVSGRAVELLRTEPSLATATAATMAACGESAALRDLLGRDPAAVARTSGPHDWPPLLYLCYARLGVGDPVATLRVLLEAGADPDAGFLWQRFPSPFTAVTGVLGGGERDEPAHPQAVALVTMLLDAGADPNDNQAFYNRQFRPDDSHLPPLLDHGAGHPRPSPWRERLGAAYPSPTEMVGEHLRTAAQHGFTDRVRAPAGVRVDPNTRGYHPILGDQTAYELALRNGHREAVELLAAAGGHSDRIGEPDLLLSAALAGDAEGVSRRREHAAALVAGRPDALRLAGEQHGVEAVRAAARPRLRHRRRRPGRPDRAARGSPPGDAELCDWLRRPGAPTRACGIGTSAVPPRTGRPTPVTPSWRRGSSTVLSCTEHLLTFDRCTTDSRCMSMTNRAVVVLRILLVLLFVGLLVGQTLSIPASWRSWRPSPRCSPRCAGRCWSWPCSGCSAARS